MEYIISTLQFYSKYGHTTRSIAKFLLHFITNKCELEWLCEISYPGEPSYGYQQSHDVEYSLYNSKHEEIRKILIADKMKTKTAMETIMRVKRIDPEKSPVFMNSMPHILHRIISYNALVNRVDEIRRTKYNEENEEHEKRLAKLWELLKPGDPLNERYTKRWGEIGFQGTNPATDFRGMGMLGLDNMVYMLENRENVALKIYGHSLHPKYGFSFAVMAINFTSSAFDLLRSSKLKGWMYNLPHLEYRKEHFQDFFTEIFSEFADYWISREPPNIMSFNEIKSDFMNGVHKRLNLGRW